MNQFSHPSNYMNRKCLNLKYILIFLAYLSDAVQAIAMVMKDLAIFIKNMVIFYTIIYIMLIIIYIVVMS